MLLYKVVRMFEGSFKTPDINKLNKLSEITLGKLAGLFVARRLIKVTANKRCCIANINTQLFQVYS